MLVLDDHPVHDRSWSSGRSSSGIRSRTSSTRARTSERELARRARSQDVQRGALTSGVAERVVQIVEARIVGVGVDQRPQEPQLLVVRDVGESQHSGDISGET